VVLGKDSLPLLMQNYLGYHYSNYLHVSRHGDDDFKS